MLYWFQIMWIARRPLAASFVSNAFVKICRFIYCLIYYRCNRSKYKFIALEVRSFFLWIVISFMFFHVLFCVCFRPNFKQLNHIIWSKSMVNSFKCWIIWRSVFLGFFYFSKSKLKPLSLKVGEKENGNH